MNKKTAYYYFGAFLIMLGCAGYYVLGHIELALIIAVLGIALVLLSNKHWWLKALTILLLPPVAVYGFVIILFAFSNETI